MQWFVRNEQPDGRWLYEFDANTGRDLGGYNTIRHSGAIMGLYMAATIGTAGAVDAWHAWLVANGVRMRSAPRTHRDGARSFYCYDPESAVVQVIHHPPVADWERSRGR